MTEQIPFDPESYGDSPTIRGPLRVGGTISISQHRASMPKPGASQRAMIHWQWPLWCMQVKAIQDDIDGDQILFPRLVKWLDPAENNGLEQFIFETVAGFTGEKYKKALFESIPPTQNGHSAVCGKYGNRADLYHITFTHFEMPNVVPFDPKYVPESDDQFGLGVLTEGSVAVWDTKHGANHGIIIGQTDSGKSVAAMVVGGQAHHKGWSILGGTPKLGDKKFMPFNAYPQHRIIFGLNPTAIGKLKHLLACLTKELRRRQIEQAYFGTSWWGDGDHAWGTLFIDADSIPADLSDELTAMVIAEGFQDGVPEELLLPLEIRSRKILFVFDEMSDYLKPGELSNEDAGALAAGKEFIVQKGREARIHGLGITQSPRVTRLGDQGGFLLGQYGLVYAVRALEPAMIPAVFPKTGSNHVSDVLTGDSPKGRGVGRGALAPDNPLGSSVVRDAPIQFFLIDPDTDELARYLASGGPVGEAEGVLGYDEDDDDDHTDGGGGVGVAQRLMADPELDVDVDPRTMRTDPPTLVEQVLPIDTSIDARFELWFRLGVVSALFLLVMVMMVVVI